MMTNKEAWSEFRGVFMEQVGEADPQRNSLYPAFAEPRKGSAGEVVVKAMHAAFDVMYSTLRDEAGAAIVKANEPQPSGAWDTDFKEPIG